MFDLLQSYAGCPTGPLQHLVLHNEALILFPSVDAIVISRARDLSLVRVLAFQEAFPSILSYTARIDCISVDSGMKLVVASAGTRIAAWSISGARNDSWFVHSSLVLPGKCNVTTVQCKSGLLAVGTQRDLSVYTLILENDLPTWSRKWSTACAAPSLVYFSPSLMYIAITSQNDNIVRLYTTTTGRNSQNIRHPRPVIRMTWRHAIASSRDDLILYTITSDSTLRIFLPVLDSPHHLQLHASLDLFSSLPFSVASEYCQTSSSVFWLDREILGNALSKVTYSGLEDNARSRRLREMKEEGWDMFVRVLSNGSLVITAVANIDRRPPTLLKQFTMHHSLPAMLPNLPAHLYLIPKPDSDSINLVTSVPLATYDLIPSLFFDVNPLGLKAVAKGVEYGAHEESRILRFVRTPDGRGVAVVRAEGGEIWRVEHRGTDLVHNGRWPAADLVAVLQEGKAFATYTSLDSTLSLYPGPSATLSLPKITKMFSILSNNDSESIIGITDDLKIVHVQVSWKPSPSMKLFSHNYLPMTSPPKFITAVESMAWKAIDTFSKYDALLSVSAQGELAFWAVDGQEPSSWKCTGKVRTGRTEFKMASCSSMKKSALVTTLPDGDELTIWDSKESEFASGLEYRTVYSTSEPINDLDWTSTPDKQSILAIGFSRHIELLCQQRLTYFDEGPGWGVCWKLSAENFIPHPISDSIWLVGGSLLIGAGHQMYLFGQSRAPAESLFEHVARHNGPLPDYHPQMLLQCLIWGKIEVVKEIIVQLAHALRATVADRKADFVWQPISIDHFVDQGPSVTEHIRSRKPYKFLFDVTEEPEQSEDNQFSSHLVERLLEDLETAPLHYLTPNEHEHLLVLIRATLEIDEQRRALDANGLRYLVALRSFYLLNQRESMPATPQSNGQINRRVGRRERLRFRDMVWAFHSESQELLLSQSISAANNSMDWTHARASGLFIWLKSLDSLKSMMETVARAEYMAGDNRDPTACSLFYFALGKVKLVQGLWRQASWHKEQTISLKFLSSDFSQPRWRTAALKNAYALLSKRRFIYAAAFFLLGGSLKDAVNVCIKQLSDFQLAVALARVVEQGDDGPILHEILVDTVLPIAFKTGNRWLGSWAFWLLHQRDLAVRILLTPLEDMVVAAGIQVEDIGAPHYDDPSLALLFSELKAKTLQAAKGTSEISGRSEFTFVLQMARIFGRMGCQVLALDLVKSWSFERPSTVVHDSLFPSTAPLQRRASRSPEGARRSLFAVEPSLRRHSSIMIDMDMQSLPPTRKASPERPSSVTTTQAGEQLKNDDDILSRKAGFGNLMKSAKQDVKIQEFDMDAFNF